MDIITTHKNTDFDGLASVIAGTLLYPGATGVIPKMVNKNVERFLSTHKTAFNLVLPNEVEHEKVERLIVVDTNQWKRLDRMDKLRNKEDLVVHLWDHHGPGNIEADWQCSENIGSTVTLLIRELRRKNITLSPLDSTVLLIGLYEDTGQLSYPGTTAEDAEAAAYLLRNKADLNVTSVFLNPPYDEVEKDVLFKLVENSQITSHRRLTIGVSIVRLNQKVIGLSSLVNIYRKLVSADIVFGIFISDELTSTIIGRSGSDIIDVGGVLKQFGGGGHPSAASATVRTSDFTPDELKDKVLEMIKENKVSSAVISDLMSYPVTMVAPNTPMREVRELMEKQKIRGILVGEEENLEGIIVLWDFKKVKQDRQWKSPVKAFMIRNVKTIPPDIDPIEAAQLMVRENIGHLPVEYEGKVIGIITRTDILTYFYDMLPD